MSSHTPSSIYSLHFRPFESRYSSILFLAATHYITATPPQHQSGVQGWTAESTANRSNNSPAPSPRRSEKKVPRAAVFEDSSGERNFPISRPRSRRIVPRASGKKSCYCAIISFISASFCICSCVCPSLFSVGVLCGQSLFVLSPLHSVCGFFSEGPIMSSSVGFRCGAVMTESSAVLFSLRISLYTHTFFCFTIAHK